MCNAKMQCNSVSPVRWCGVCLQSVEKKFFATENKRRVILLYKNGYSPI